ncbi:hypothetical protein BLNAU_3780 [Blattamonas nauphoetae]|uniref:Uncharacterized protein n=1 Tax=Blattamonas nauphoetae TaxID=2049346 RepID=A0ABQ9YC71_9EUKA|nr:hypothetical protein BLNAU_3780 [Blattamonas nauphoetae]
MNSDNRHQGRMLHYDNDQALEANPSSKPKQNISLRTVRRSDIPSTNTNSNQPTNQKKSLDEESLRTLTKNVQEALQGILLTDPSKQILALQYLATLSYSPNFAECFMIQNGVEVLCALIPSTSNHVYLKLILHIMTNFTIKHKSLCNMVANSPFSIKFIEWVQMKDEGIATHTTHILSNIVTLSPTASLYLASLGLAPIIVTFLDKSKSEAKLVTEDDPPRLLAKVNPDEINIRCWLRILENTVEDRIDDLTVVYLIDLISFFFLSPSTETITTAVHALRTMLEKNDDAVALFFQSELPYFPGEPPKPAPTHFIVITFTALNIVSLYDSLKAIFAVVAISQRRRIWSRDHPHDTTLARLPTGTNLALTKHEQTVFDDSLKQATSSSDVLYALLSLIGYLLSSSDDYIDILCSQSLLTLLGDTLNLANDYLTRLKNGQLIDEPALEDLFAGKKAEGKNAGLAAVVVVIPPSLPYFIPTPEQLEQDRVWCTNTNNTVFGVNLSSVVLDNVSSPLHEAIFAVSNISASDDPRHTNLVLNNIIAVKSGGPSLFFNVLLSLYNNSDSSSQHEIVYTIRNLSCGTKEQVTLLLSSDLVSNILQSVFTINHSPSLDDIPLYETINALFDTFLRQPPPRTSDQFLTLFEISMIAFVLTLDEMGMDYHTALAEQYGDPELKRQATLALLSFRKVLKRLPIDEKRKKMMIERLS